MDESRSVSQTLIPAARLWPARSGGPVADCCALPTLPISSPPPLRHRSLRPRPFSLLPAHRSLGDPLERLRSPGRDALAVDAETVGMGDGGLPRKDGSCRWHGAGLHDGPQTDFAYVDHAANLVVRSESRDDNGDHQADLDCPRWQVSCWEPCSRLQLRSSV